MYSYVKVNRSQNQEIPKEEVILIVTPNTKKISMSFPHFCMQCVGSTYYPRKKCFPLETSHISTKLKTEIVLWPFFAIFLLD